MQRQRRLSVPFSFLQAVYWAMFAISVSFLVPLLKDKGFTASAIGITMSVSAVAATFAQPLWGALSDRINRTKPFLLVGCGMSGFIYLLLVHATSHVLITILVVIIGATLQSLQAITDSWSAKLTFAGFRVNYGISRSMGSLSYAITSLLFGLAISKLGMEISPWVLLILAVIMFLILIQLPEPPAHHRDDKFSFKQAAHVLLKNPHLMVFIFCFFLVTLNASSFITFYPLFLEQLGGTSVHLGMGYFVIAICEIPTMSYYSKLEKRFGTLPLLVFSMVGHALRCITVALSGSVTMAILGMSVQVIAYGIALPAYMSYIGKVVDHRYLSTAVMITFALGLSLSQIIGNAVGGYMAEIIGIRNMMLSLSVFPVLAAIIMTIYAAVKKPLSHIAKEES